MVQYSCTCEGSLRIRFMIWRCKVVLINHNCELFSVLPRVFQVGLEVLEDDEGSPAMPHQWVEGNLPVSSRCWSCERTCGSVLRLQDWRCLWCRATVHTACRPVFSVQCPLGLCRVSCLDALTCLDKSKTPFKYRGSVMIKRKHYLVQTHTK